MKDTVAYYVNDKEVIFKVNNQIYRKTIKKNNNSVNNYKNLTLESVNIKYNDLDDKYVYVDSNNQASFNKILLKLHIIIIIVSMLGAGLLMYLFDMIFLPIMLAILVNSTMIFHIVYVHFIKRKNMYKKYTEITDGEIIDYRREEYRHDKDYMLHCNYSLMYKFKGPDNKIIYSVLHDESAKLLYQDYPLHKKILVRYNPNKWCESCLADEYDSFFSDKKFIKRSTMFNMVIGKVTNIKSSCIDEKTYDFLKEYSYVDYVECKYMVGDNNYKNYSIFGVPHDRFKIDEEIIIFYEQDNPNKFFCDINKKYSNSDKYDYNY
ncbi:MAG: hypothetical protein VZS44_01715 [Bacilli bacterium]|nr:hypothetical protein [Bacilli bacterium]